VDAIALEPQFVDHLAPIWQALEQPGVFLTSAHLEERTRRYDIDAALVDDARLRRSSLPPRARVEDGPRALVASIGDIKVGRRLGYRRFAFIEHGAGQAYLGDGFTPGRRHSSYAGGLDRDDVELFMVPNEYSAALWRRAYPSARVEVVGSPRLDTLPRRVGAPGRVVAISFHWPALVAPEAGSAIGHYRRALPELARAFDVIGHAHPKGDWPRRVKRYYDQAGIEFVSDFAEVCERADVYVVDNSSTLFEFASTGRPVVVLNAPWYRRHVNHGLRFWDAASVGVNVDRPADLIAGIDEALRDDSRRRTERERALDIAYGFRSGGAQRAASAVVRWLDDA